MIKFHNLLVLLPKPCACLGVQLLIYLFLVPQYSFDNFSGDKEVEKESKRHENIG